MAAPAVHLIGASVTESLTAAVPFTEIPAGGADVSLVVTDMDGTLLRPDGQVPDGFWDLLDRMRERGITFVPASGRQLATLQETFAERGGITSYIAENGTLVVLDGEVVSTTTIEPETAADAVGAARELVATGGRDLGVVLCGVHSAYIERADDAFLAEAGTYYKRLEVVEDLTAVDDQFLKVAIHDFVDAEQTAPFLQRFQQTHQVVVSGKHWIDIMHPAADKGVGVRALQSSLGVDAERTAVFGDYLNDLAMYDESRYSFAMAEAHEGIVAVANYLAPSNAEDGVLQVIEHLLG